ncbi:hypothetical protein [Psychrobacter sp.]|uniref:hypothetical protein n=1 Tax=Psychrobacter sp. TaxID=56811 RepID=UPI0025D60A88|nr:hypothetical protein [Psychrobacter sp.]
MSINKISKNIPATHDSLSPSETPNRRGTLTKLFVISAIGIGLSFFSNSKLVANAMADKVGQDSLKPQVIVGSVHKSLEQFSLTSEQGMQYHISDPSNILDDLAKKRGVVDSFYTLNRVRVKAIISKAGNYGHMGFYERQINIVGIADS